MRGANRKEFGRKQAEPNRPGPDLYALIRQKQMVHIAAIESRGQVLFSEGNIAQGVYILKAGLVSVSVSSREGRVVILRMAQSGDVLGLNAVLADGLYETSVRAVTTCHTEFIPRNVLMSLVQNDLGGAQIVFRALSQELTELTDRAKSLLLAGSVISRLARLLLNWSEADWSAPADQMRLDKVLTHEEIAQMLSASRETVTRLLGELSRRQVISIDSQSIVIRDLQLLEKLAQE